MDPISLLSIIIAFNSLLFRVVTLFVYCIVPDLNNLPGKCLRRNIISGCLVDMFFILRDIKYISDFNSTGPTVIIGIILHYGALSNIFWSNVLCYDIWWNFRFLLESENTSELEKEKRFKKYKFYAWGMPIIVIGSIQLIGRLLNELFTEPSVSEEHLFPKENDDLHIFIFKLNLFAFNTFILSNVIGFFLITWLIYKYEKQARKMQSEDSSFSNLPQKRFYIYFKLFLILGLLKLVHLILICVISKIDLSFTSIKMIELIPRSEGVLIFISLICNHRMLSKVFNQLCIETNTPPQHICHR
ncbi:putative G-protein coupled receptor Mth-like 11 isoform X1 [Lycorma delicatula]|uniref:putative G-protein coupled receptor Mth-like 11 isoform X1 n=1 Tax=Lycorma delicatula TaxID=130591 RepID=UPI003F515ED6